MNSVLGWRHNFETQGSVILIINFIDYGHMLSLVMTDEILQLQYW